jgi:methanogenic corrinoid protein MtbC1
MEIPISYSEELERALLLLDRKRTEEILNEVSTFGSPVEVAGQLISSALKNIGDAWEKGNLALSQVYMSGIICEELIDKILPPQSSVRISQPKMAIGVFEDYHLLGKRIVYSTLRASGFELTDLGGGLSIETLVDVVVNEKIKILLLSVLMLPSALRIKELKKKLTGIDVKVIVGGAPFRFDEKLWKEVEADGYGKDSSDAIKIVNQLMEEMK